MQRLKVLSFWIRPKKRRTKEKSKRAMQKFRSQHFTRENNEQIVLFTNEKIQMVDSHIVAESKEIKIYPTIH